MNDTTDTIAEIAPNGSVPLLVWCGVLGCGPEIAVNTSMSNWIRWSGLSMEASMNVDR